MPIYSNIKEACKKKGISVMKLETELGFARSSIYKWDKHQPSIGKITLPDYPECRVYSVERRSSSL